MDLPLTGPLQRTYLYTLTDPHISVASISDADVFCFITNFRNPNCLDFENIDNDTFDALYLIIKIANSLSIKPLLPEPDLTVVVKKKNAKVEPKPRKPIIFADGLVTMDILKTLSQNLPYDVLFCPSPLPALAKYVLGDHLKVGTHNLDLVPGT